ncbi:DUF1887 family protein [candidate division KSB1 bacterium]|nr:DUF1887 family protein [candidate division KSB1 bacterium]
MNDIKKMHPIIKLFRSNESLPMPNTMKLTQKSIKDYKIDIHDLIAVLTLFQKNGLVTRFEQKENGDFSYRIETKDDHNFLFGDWLEYYIWMQTSSLKFDDIQMSVELADLQGEIDVFCVFGANSILCECKTGKFDSKDMDRLQTKANKLGADYCSRILVTTQWKVDEEKDRQAAQHKIVLITGKQLGQIREIFSREMKTPTYHRR